jgi:hypothetical protein
MRTGSLGLINPSPEIRYPQFKGQNADRWGNFHPESPGISWEIIETA